MPTPKYWRPDANFEDSGDSQMFAEFYQRAEQDPETGEWVNVDGIRIIP